MKHCIFVATLAATFVLTGAVVPTTALAEDTPTAQQMPRKDSDSVAVREGAPQSGTDGRNTQAPGVGSDGEALGMLQAINEHEIAAAALAKQKGVSAPVMQYADMLDKEHGANLSKTRLVSDEAGVNIFDSKDVEMMKEKSKAERDMLAAKDGSAFEAAFVDAMVAGHAEALAAIDNDLLPAAGDARVKRHLTETRAHIAQHLEAAKGLQASASTMR